MKKNLKFVYTLLIILVFINCTAKDNMKSKQIYGNVQQDKTETIIQEQENDINLNDDQDPPVVLTDENTPETELIKLLESRKRHAWSLHEIQLEIDMYDVHGNSYEEFEKSSIDYLNRQKNTEIVKLDSNNKNIYCKQT